MYAHPGLFFDSVILSVDLGTFSSIQSDKEKWCMWSKRYFADRANMLRLSVARLAAAALCDIPHFEVMCGHSSFVLVPVQPKAVKRHDVI